MFWAKLPLLLQMLLRALVDQLFSHNFFVKSFLSFWGTAKTSFRLSRNHIDFLEKVGRHSNRHTFNKKNKKLHPNRNKTHWYGSEKPF